jgi:hypothetical protein
VFYIYTIPEFLEHHLHGGGTLARNLVQKRTLWRPHDQNVLVPMHDLVD